VIAAIVAMLAVTAISAVSVVATMVVVSISPVPTWKNTAREKKHRGERDDQHFGRIHEGFLLSRSGEGVK
jgi:hypothetical protein